MEIQPVFYGTTRGRMLLYLLGSLMFVAIGAVMFLDSSAKPIFHWAGLASVILFGLCAAFYLGETIRPRGGVRLDDEGIHMVGIMGLKGFSLPWNQLAGVRLVKINRNPFVVLDPIDPEWGLVGIPRGTAFNRRSNRALMGSWMTIPPNMFGTKPEVLMDEIHRQHRVRLGGPVEYPRPVASR